jgi:hypothetical protein
MAKKPKKYSVLVRASVSENSIVEDVRAAIRREVGMGDEISFRWTPAKPPMSLIDRQWQATGDTIVADLQGKYPGLVVKRQEIKAHYTKQLTVFRVFLTTRIKKPA